MLGIELTSKESRSEFLSEVQASLELVIPLVIAQILEAGITFVDAIMMGLLGNQSLAAGGLGAVSFSTISVVSGCTLSAVGAIAANGFGAGKIDRVRSATVHGMWLAGAISLPIMFLIWHFDFILPLLGQEESNVVLATSYLQAIVWGLPAAMGLWVLKEVGSAVSRPQFITVIMAVGLILDAIGNYVLMFGKFGLPALGLAGLGWSSTIVLWLNFTIAMLWVGFHPDFRDYKLFSDRFKFDRTMFVDIVANGWSLGIQYGAEIGVFTAIALVMGYLGTNILAAHEIAVETVHFVQMIPVGISYATMMRVGQMSGQNDLVGARRAALVGLLITVPLMSVVGLILWLFPLSIVRLYLDINNPDNVEIIKMAISFLGVAAIVQLFYSIQAVAAGALLALKDTRKPMLINLIAYWVIGFGGGYLVGIKLNWGSTALWWGLAVGLLISAAILPLRFYFLTKHLLSIAEDDRSEDIVAKTPVNTEFPNSL